MSSSPSSTARGCEMAPAPLLLSVMLAGYAAGGLVGLGWLGAGLAPTFTASFLPLTGLALRVDGLSAFFLIVIGVVGAAVAGYGFGYSAAYEGRQPPGLLGAVL